MQGMKFRKFYLARVRGDFAVDTERLQYARESEGLIDCTAPLMTVEHKLGLSCVADSTVYPAAKHSHTRFIKLSHDPATEMSTILCEPVTGRTHQIRLHLQYLGYPIHNDPLYNNAFWKKLLTDTDADNGSSVTNDTPASTKENSPVYSRSDWLDKVKAMAQDLSKSPSIFPQDEALPADYSFEICPDCENPHADPEPVAMRIDLHAYKYSGPMGTFSTALPEWVALENDEVLKQAEESFNKYAVEGSGSNDNLDEEEL